MRPNILVIMTDQHSKHVLGCYGNPVVRTPNLDRLAADGMLFTSAYCPGPLCVPSRMSFMTCRAPSQNRVWDNAHILSSGLPTWAHSLGAAQYETSLIGRMHFIGPDQRHGFENRPIGEYHARHPGTPETGGPRWTRFPASTSGQRRVSVELAGTGTTTYQWADAQITERAVEYLRRQGSPKPRRVFRTTPLPCRRLGWRMMWSFCSDELSRRCARRCTRRRIRHHILSLSRSDFWHTLPLRTFSTAYRKPESYIAPHSMPTRAATAHRGNHTCRVKKSFGHESERP